MSDALALIAEWKSPDFQAQPLMEVVLLISLYLVLTRGMKLPLIRVLVVLGLMHMFLHHVRHAELLANPGASRNRPGTGAGLASDAMRPRGQGSVWRPCRTGGRNMLALSLVLGIVYIGGLTRFGGVRPPDDAAPTAALAFAREAGLTKGRMLNHYGYGS